MSQTDTIEIWHACVLLVIHGIAGVFWMPAQVLMIHDIVGDELTEDSCIPSAVSINEIGHQLVIGLFESRLFRIRSGVRAQITTRISTGVGAIRAFTIQPSNFMCMK